MTELRLYDTAQRQLCTWQPPHHRDIRIYVCGITPYDSAHLGHILTFMTYDLLQRFLEDRGRTVTMVRNVTDVDEPIYAKARQLNINYLELARQETVSFHKVLAKLNFRPLSHEPLASQYIEPMAAAVAKLLASGMAYYVDNDIYFDTAQDRLYGAFCGFSKRLQGNLLKLRGGDPDRPGKRHPLDFLLWRSIADEADPAAWTTILAPVVPRGRPGWHIECSVMSSALLSTPFDLHGGGTDLIFPHHESEIAQTRALVRGARPAVKTTHAADEVSLAQRWLHVAPLYYCGEKMSKSLGNLVFAKDLLQDYEPSVIRLALMNYHYRVGGEWMPGYLQEAVDLLSALRAAMSAGYISEAAAATFGLAIRTALADDLDTPAIVHALRNLAAAPAKPPGAASPHIRALLEPTLAMLGLRL